MTFSRDYYWLILAWWTNLVWGFIHVCMILLESFADWSNGGLFLAWVSTVLVGQMVVKIYWHQWGGCGLIIPQQNDKSHWIYNCSLFFFIWYIYLMGCVHFRVELVQKVRGAASNALDSSVLYVWPQFTLSSCISRIPGSSPLIYCTAGQKSKKSRWGHGLGMIIGQDMLGHRWSFYLVSFMC